MPSYLRRLIAWLFGPRLLWFFLSVTLFCSIIAFFPNVSEPRLRIIGLLLQLCGIGTVLKGISDTRQVFGRPTLFDLLARWLQAFPKRKTDSAVGLGVSSIETASAFGRATVWLQPPANAGTDDQIRVLESNVEGIRNYTADLQRQIDQSNRQTKDALTVEKQSREHQIDELAKRLETTETGGLYIALVGVLWVAIGLIMSTASVELSRLQ